MKTFYTLGLTFLFLSGIILQSFGASIIHNPVAETNPVKHDSTSVSTAVHDFMSLSRSDRRLRIKEAKSAIKEYKAEKRSGIQPSTNQLLLVILAIILPPLAVYLHEGVINNKFWLDLLLTLLFFLPGVIYALIVVLAK